MSRYHNHRCLHAPAFAFILLVCVFGSLLAGTPALPSPPPDVTVRNGLVTLDARDADIRQVLGEIAATTGVSMTVAADVTGRITLQMNDVPLEEALRRLCANRTLIYEYLPETKTYRIVGAGAYASSGKPFTPSVTGPTDPTPSTLSNEPGRQANASVKERLYDRQGRPRYRAREILVKFKDGTTQEQIDDLNRRLGSTVMKVTKVDKIYRLRIREGLSEKEAIPLYAASGLADVAQRNPVRYTQASPITPNDSDYNRQWAPAKVHLPEAWSLTQGKHEIIVAVIDTGVDYNHPDLAANIWSNSGEIPGNGIDDDRNGFIDDVHGWDFAGADYHIATDGDADPMDVAGHGTHVAGIIAAVGNNTLGVAGVAWNVRVLPLKVQADNATNMDMPDIIDAIDYAITKGARIVNCSFGGDVDVNNPKEVQEMEGERLAFERLRTAGILAVCAAGNQGVNNDTDPLKIYPASHGLDNIISVAASVSSDALWGSSNYGAASVDVMAPGVSIYSTWAPGARSRYTDDDCFGISYCSVSGTSMATPHVSGIAALLLSLNPSLTYGQVKAAILDTAETIDTRSLPVGLKNGRVNAYAALMSLTIMGDITGDKKTDLADAVAALQILAGMQPVFTPEAVPLAGDVNGDGRVGLAEAIHALQTTADLRSNHAPHLDPIGNRSVDEGSSLAFQISALDADGDPLTYSAAGLPEGASFNPTTRQFLWTPTYEQSGVYSVIFTVADGRGASASETIRVTVNDITPTMTVTDYFPLNVGDWWEYNDGTALIKRSSIATDLKDVNGTTTTVMAYSDGNREYYTADQNGLILYGEYVSVASPPYTGEVIFNAPILLMPNRAAVLTSQRSDTGYYIDYLGQRTYFQLTAITTILGLEDVQAGNTLLKDCIKVSVQQTHSYLKSIISDKTDTYWFYKGVGCVKKNDDLIITSSIKNVITIY